MGRQRNLTVIDADWMDQANCAGIDSAVFFDPHHEAEAKAICGGCEVRINCLRASFALGFPDGVWGGKNYIERRRFRRAEQKAARDAR